MLLKLNTVRRIVLNSIFTYIFITTETHILKFSKSRDSHFRTIPDTKHTTECMVQQCKDEPMVSNKSLQ